MSELIVGILEEIFEDSRKHNESKGQIAFDCPACSADKGMPQGDGKGNLEVNYYKGVFKCWACWQYNDMSGPLPKLIKKYGNKKHLKEYYLLKPESKPEVIKQVPTNLTLPKGFHSLMVSKKHDRDYLEVMKYLKGRNIGMDIIRRHGLGYLNLDFENKTTNKYHGRLIIPSYDADGELNYFTGRAYSKYIWPKYDNLEADKKEIIFNEKLINWDATIYLVEGPIDHLVVPNSIPLLGKYMSDKLFNLLLTKATANIVIVFDGDARSDALYLHKKLNVNQLYGRIRVVFLPNERDIAEIHQVLGSNGVLKVLRKAKKISESRDYTRVRLREN